MIKKFTSIEEVNNLTNDDVFKPKITVIGVGGAGTNAVNNMIDMDLQGVKFIVINTDSQSLEKSTCSNKLQIGPKVTKGLGAGSRPEIGIQAAEESSEHIKSILEGTNMLFITCGMGGGTGTGASQVIAKIAKDMGILTIAFITKPFEFEGSQRIDISLLGTSELEKVVDALVVISNQNLFKIIDPNTSMLNAFRATDSVLYSGVKAITDLLISSGLVNLDFNDIRSVIENMGRTMIGAAEASGEDRAEKVAKAAILNPLLEEVSIKGAKKALINITGGDDMTLFEIDAIINIIKFELSEEAFINFGTVYDNNMQDNIRVSVVATGLDPNVKQNKYALPKTSEKIATKQQSSTPSRRPAVNRVYKEKLETIETPIGRTIATNEVPSEYYQPESYYNSAKKEPNLMRSHDEVTIAEQQQNQYFVEPEQPNIRQTRFSNATYQKTVSFINDEEINEAREKTAKSPLKERQVEYYDEEDADELEDNVFESRIEIDSQKDAEYAKQKESEKRVKEEEFFEENEEVGLFELIAKKNKFEMEAKKQNDLNEDSLMQIKNRDKISQSKKVVEEDKDISFFDLPSFLKKKK